MEGGGGRFFLCQGGPVGTAPSPWDVSAPHPHPGTKGGTRGREDRSGAGGCSLPSSPSDAAAGWGGGSPAPIALSGCGAQLPHLCTALSTYVQGMGVTGRHLGPPPAQSFPYVPQRGGGARWGLWGPSTSAGEGAALPRRPVWGAALQPRGCGMAALCAFSQPKEGRGAGGGSSAAPASPSP